MSLEHILRNALDIPKVTEDGLKYQIVNNEVKIVGFRKNVSISAIPSHIEDFPVRSISLPELPLSGELYIPDTVHTIITIGLTKGITKLFIPDSVKEIANNAFGFSEALEEIRFPEGMDFSDALEGIASSCEKLKTVHLPSTMTRIPVCFLSSCEALEEIDIPDSVTVIDDCAFSYCESLKRVHLPKALKALNEMAFSDCEALEEIQLPEGLEYIGKRAFSGCESLQSIRIPSTVTKIDKHAFELCPKLVKPDIPAGCAVHEKAFD